MRCKLDGIGNQVEQYLLQPIFVSFNNNLPRRVVFNQLDGFLTDQRASHADHKLTNLFQVSVVPIKRQLTIFHGGKVNDIIDQAGETLRADLHQSQCFALRCCQCGRLLIRQHDFGQADDASQWRTQLV